MDQRRLEPVWRAGRGNMVPGMDGLGPGRLTGFHRLNEVTGGQKVQGQHSSCSWGSLGIAYSGARKVRPMAGAS